VLRLFAASNRIGAVVGKGDSIYLACDKPLDPSTLRSGAFRLARFGTEDSVSVRVRILENHPQAMPARRPASVRSSAPAQVWERERRACLIEITPEVPLVPRARGEAGSPYFLRLGLGSDAVQLPRDYGGNPVVVDAPPRGWSIEVHDLGADLGRTELHEDFADTRMRSGVALPGYDGTAAWTGSGRVTCRYPLAAGDGTDGRVVLAAQEDRDDVQASSINLPAGVAGRLRSTPGLVVLRSQGRITLRGGLVREAPWDPTAESHRDEALVAWSRWNQAEKDRREAPVDAGSPVARDRDAMTLSDWLAAARAADRNWTVLIAGGDLVIEGNLASSGPILLVAGGAIRVSGSVRAATAAVEIRVGVGGDPIGQEMLGGVFIPRENGVSHPGVQPFLAAYLHIDEPVGANPLRTSLRLAVLSAPVPPSGGVLGWLPHRLQGSPTIPAGAARSSWSVRFLPELQAAPRDAGDLARAVDDPMLLRPPGPIQFLIELEIAPGGEWDPPWVDSVRLAWERPLETPTTLPGGR
jgi:hypothetical protein